MKNAKRIILILLSILLILGTVNWYVKDKERKELLKQEQEIAHYYDMQNDAFFISTEYISNNQSPLYEVYFPYEDVRSRVDLYVGLLIYERETGNVLTLEEVEEYLSQEFEEDGTRRLYINYEEADIQGYVEFMRMMMDKSVQQHEEWRAQLDPNIPIEEQPQPEMWEDRGLTAIYNRILFQFLPLRTEFEAAGYGWTNLPLPIIEEFVKKAYDPEYEMQLEGLF